MLKLPDRHQTGKKKSIFNTFQEIKEKVENIIKSQHI